MKHSIKGELIIFNNSIVIEGSLLTEAIHNYYNIDLITEGTPDVYIYLNHNNSLLTCNILTYKTETPFSTSNTYTSTIIVKDITILTVLDIIFNNINSFSVLPKNFSKMLEYSYKHANTTLFEDTYKEDIIDVLRKLSKGTKISYIQVLNNKDYKILANFYFTRDKIKYFETKFGLTFNNNF